MKKFGRPEKVHIEHEWYDGPRSGIADINGEPHRFKSIFSEEKDDYLDTFIIFRVSDKIFQLEKEQWSIFVHWNQKYENGEVGTDSHPGIKGNNDRYTELEMMLEQPRRIIPEDAKTAEALFTRIKRKTRYEISGPNYMLSWRLYD